MKIIFVDETRSITISGEEQEATFKKTFSTLLDEFLRGDEAGELFDYFHEMFTGDDDILFEWFIMEMLLTAIQKKKISVTGTIFDEKNDSERKQAFRCLTAEVDGRSYSFMTNTKQKGPDLWAFFDFQI